MYVACKFRCCLIYFPTESKSDRPSFLVDREQEKGCEPTAFRPADYVLHMTLDDPVGL